MPKVPVSQNQRHLQRLLSEVGAEHNVALRLERRPASPGNNRYVYRVRMHFDTGQPLPLCPWTFSARIRLWVKAFYFGAGIAEVVATHRTPVGVE